MWRWEPIYFTYKVGGLSEQLSEMVVDFSSAEWESCLRGLCKHVNKLFEMSVPASKILLSDFVNRLLQYLFYLFQ